MGNEPSSGASSDKRQHPSSSSAAAKFAANHYSVNRPIGSDSSPPQSNFNLHNPAGSSASSASSSSASASTSGAVDDGKHRIVVVNSGPRPDTGTLSDELRALGTLPTFMPLIKSTASASGHADSSLVPSAERVDHRSLLHFCARYQEHLKQCAEAVAFDQNSLCGRIKELETSARGIQDSLQERHKKFQRLAEQIHKVTELRSMLARMRSHARHLGALMEELNAALPADCQLEPFSWQSTLPQQQQQPLQQSDSVAATAASTASTPSPANSLIN